jgi:1-acyl-sn-glycerol-3-phosphate acyltransferase
MIRSVITIGLTFAYILLLGPPLLFYAAMTGNTDPLYGAGLAGARMALWLAGARVMVEGREKIPRARAVVFMPNHQSNMDTPAIIVNIPSVLVLAKKEFFRVPVLGRVMTRRGFIAVERTNRERAIAAVERAARSLQAGYSFLAFPEGTRSRDGRLQPFKRGVFVMAIKAGAPIVPVSISGSRHLMRKGDWRIYPGTIRIRFHDPVPTEGSRLEDRGKIIARVRQAILSGLEPDERPLEAAESVPLGFPPGRK